MIHWQQKERTIKFLKQIRKPPTQTNPTEKNAKKKPNVPVHSQILFPMVTEDKDANTVSKQDEATKQATNESVKNWIPETKQKTLLLTESQRLTRHFTLLH